MAIDKIKKDLQEALKEKESLRISTLRLLLSIIQGKEKEKRFKESLETEIPLSEEEVVGVIRSEIKKRRESIKIFETGNRDDLAEKEKKELDILKQYLPQEISEEKLEEIVKKAIKETGAEGPKDIGKVMAEVMPKIKGSADGSAVSQKAKQLLG